MLRTIVASAVLLLSACTSYPSNRPEPLTAALTPRTPAPATEAEAPAARSAPAVRSQDVDTKYGPEVGESILQFAGSLTSTDSSPGETTDTFSLLGGIGYFQSEWLELGGQVIGNWSEDFTSFFISPYANYNHRINRKLWLYAGPHLGIGYFDIPGDEAIDFEYGLHGGARYWVEPRTSLFGELRYTAASVELGGVDIDFDTTQLLFGFSVVF